MRSSRGNRPIWRTAVAGLIFLPLHVYVWWLLLTLAAAPARVSPGRRWKVWAAVVLNIPLWCFMVLLVVVVGALVPQAPDDPFATVHWEAETLAAFEREVSVQLPNPYGRQAADSMTADGELIEECIFFTNVKSTQFVVIFKQYPRRFAQRPPEQLYRHEIEELKLDNAPAQLVEEKKAILANRPAREVTLKGQAVLRYRFFVADNRLYGLMVSGSDEDVRSDDAALFFGSFRLR